MIYDAHAYLGVDPSWEAWGLPVPLEGEQWVQLMDEAGIAVMAHMPIYKVFSTKVKGFQYIPADLVNLHTVSIG